MNIWIPSNKWIEANDELKAPMPKLAGYVRCVLRNSDGSIAQDTGWMKNMIVSGGFYRYMPNGPTSPYPSYAQVGSNATAPAFTQTTCITPLSTWENLTAGGLGFTDGASPYNWRNYEYRFAAGNGTGTIAEIAFNNSSNGAHPIARCLIVDGGGSPTTIVKGVNQVLDVTYQQRCYIPMVDVTGVVAVAGVNYDYTMRPLNIDDTYWHWSGIASKMSWSSSGSFYSAYTGTLVTRYQDQNNITGSLGTLNYDSEFYATIYEYGNYGAYDYSWKGEFQAGLDYWNSQVRTVVVRPWGTGSLWQCQFDSQVTGLGIPKTGDQLLRLRFQFGMDQYP